MKKAILLLVVWLSGIACCYAGSEDMLLVKKRIKESYFRVLNDAPEVREEIRNLLEQSANPDIMIRELREGSDYRQAERFMDAMRPDGSWSDINYADKSRSGWAPSYHADRLRVMAIAYDDPESLLFRSKELSEALHRGLTWWFAGNFRCPNWWYNEIGVPKMMGAVFLILETEMSGEELQNAIKYMENSRLGQTGQNSVWQAENVLIRSLLQGDEELFLRARSAILKEVRINAKGEGIRPDRSFHQHGAQQQFGNYGLAFANTEAYWARMFSGTGYALSEEQMSVLRTYLLEGMWFTVWKGYMDVGACGRQLFRGSLRGKALSLGKAVRNMMEADPDYREVYERFYRTDIVAAEQADRLTGNRFFRFSDYGVHRTESWSAALKMSSSRVIGSEIVNAENLLGKYLGAGALFLYETGAEYRDIFPVWDWTKLPGVTAFDTDALFPGKVGGAEYRNPHEFVGGVSDGSAGGAAMVLANEGLTALKSWFFTEDAVICLGSSISGASPYRVTTALEQKNGTGKVKILERSEGKPVSCLCDGIVYRSLDNQPLLMSEGVASGNWNRVAAFYDTAVVRQEVFTLWFDHGVSPVSARYAYALFSEGSVRRKMKKLEVPLVIRQDEQVHAVRMGERTQFVFFEPASVRLPEGTVLSADKRCILQIRRNGGEYLLILSDPSWQEETITLCLTGKWRGEESRYEAGTDCTFLTFDVKQAEGKTFFRTLSRFD